MSRLRVHVISGALGLALGVVMSGAGLSDWGEVHRMFTFGLPGGPTADDLRLTIGFAGALAIALAGFHLLARHDDLPAKPIRSGTVPGAILFGAGWALSGTCPAAALVQVGEGKPAALVTIGGMLAGMWLHDRLRKRFGWARHSCID